MKQKWDVDAARKPVDAVMVTAVWNERGRGYRVNWSQDEFEYLRDSILSQWTESERVLLRLGGFDLRAWVDDAVRALFIVRGVLSLGYPATSMNPQAAEMKVSVERLWVWLTSECPPACRHLELPLVKMGLAFEELRPEKWVRPDSEPISFDFGHQTDY